MNNDVVGHTPSPNLYLIIYYKLVPMYKVIVGHTPSPNLKIIINYKLVPMNKVVVGHTPSPNLKKVQSKVGSLQNTNHKVKKL